MTKKRTLLELFFAGADAGDAGFAATGALTAEVGFELTARAVVCGTTTVAEVGAETDLETFLTGRFIDLAVDFFATFLVAAFFVAAFFVVGFLAADFLTVAFFADAFLAVFFTAFPAGRFAATFFAGRFAEAFFFAATTSPSM